jgi:hypothetical protein
MNQVLRMCHFTSIGRDKFCRIAGRAFLALFLYFVLLLSLPLITNPEAVMIIGAPGSIARIASSSQAEIIECGSGIGMTKWGGKSDVVALYNNGAFAVIPALPLDWKGGGTSC